VHFFDIFSNEKMHFPNEKQDKKSFQVYKKGIFPYENGLLQSKSIQKIHEFSTIRHAQFVLFSPIEISVFPMKNVLFSTFSNGIDHISQ